MQDQDKAGASDSVLQELLASVAEHTDDSSKKAVVLDFLLTVEPLPEWPEPAHHVVSQISGYVISLARMRPALERGQDSQPHAPDSSHDHQ
ncbi:hypothetical protein CIW49_26705 [Mycolicibacterium sp. P1-18]|uniref:hypothetical protein n=1 Tax=Mycolicibacterium sp. P1-18 TaxID=2024615 RepID=UPI0011F20E67|nr:hypothetical protein [Mycolicibacterium sp. P1-18]KAA0093642.1 hypothetical protein CIW49_26705 [Mycolicibacterium sp. P1-18]